MPVPPRVEGYDEAEEGVVYEAEGADYSEEGLRKLRFGNTEGKHLARERGEDLGGLTLRESVEGRGGRRLVGNEGDLGRERWGDDGKGRKMGESAEIEWRGGAEKRAPRGKADPFSEEWKEGTARGGIVDDDGDIVVVDDFTGVDDVENGEGGFAQGDVEIGGSDEDEWETELLRRVGRAGITEGDEMMKRARRIVKKADETVGDAKGAGRCLQKVKKAREEWQRRLSLGEEKLGALIATVERGTDIMREREVEMRRIEERIMFYERIKSFVDGMMDMLRKKKEQILMVRGELLVRLEKEAEEVRSMLEGGVDEFGRKRLGTVGRIQLQRADDEVDVLADVEEDVKSVEKVVELFREWRERYRDDYDQAFGDAGLGKLTGRLVLASGKTEFEVVRRLLHGVQTKEMWRAAEGGNIVPALIRARWYPRDGEDCLEYSTLGREVLEADVGYAEGIVEAFRERGKWEMEGCLNLKEWEKGMECLKGIIKVTKEIRRDIGLEEALKEAEKMEVEESVWSSVEGEIGWIAGGGNGYVGEECRRIARRLCDKMGWGWMLNDTG